MQIASKLNVPHSHRIDAKNTTRNLLFLRRCLLFYFSLVAECRNAPTFH